MNERRHDDVNTAAIAGLSTKLDEHIKNATSFWEATHIRSGAMSDDIEDIKVALFSKDSNNKFGQVGIQVTAKNIDNHITFVCKMADLGSKIFSWGWKIVLGALGLMTALKAAGVL